MTFDPNAHLSNLKGKDYLEVKWRLVWFHEATSAKAGYVTVETSHEVGKSATFFTVAWNGEGNDWRIFKARGIEIEVCGRVATGEGSETKQDFNDYYEKAATKSLGRALAGLGFGTQFAPELDEGEREGEKRVVDSPVQRQQAQPQKPAQAQKPTPIKQEPKQEAPAQSALMEAPPVSKTLPDDGSPANDAQRRAVANLCDKLGRERPALGKLTFVQASALILQLNQESKKAS